MPTDASALSKKSVVSAIEQAVATGAEPFDLYPVPRYLTSYFERGISVAKSKVARTKNQWGRRASLSTRVCDRKAVRPRWLNSRQPFERAKSAGIQISLIFAAFLLLYQQRIEAMWTFWT